MVLGVKFGALDRSNHEIAAVGRRRIAERCCGTNRFLGLVGTHHVDEVADLRSLGERGGVHLLKPCDVLENHLQLPEETLLLRIGQTQPRKGGDVSTSVRDSVMEHYYPDL